MKRIAIFASGNGTNTQRIAEYFASNNNVEISIILTNKIAAGVLMRAESLNLRAETFTKNDFAEHDKVDLLMDELNIDLIVLAGFLWLVPDFLIQKYQNRIINIHPALLPKYGGKGMYGMRVHKSVIEAHETQSGISIHYVNNKYDEGDMIFQARCDITESDTPDSLAAKIHELEYKYFPLVIEDIIKNKI